MRPNVTDPIALNITSDEIWTDDPRSTTEGALTYLNELAKDLRAEDYCEGEPLTDDSSSEAAPVSTTLGALAAVLATPFLLVWAIIRLSWVLWQIERGKN